MGCVACGRRQTDPARGASPWRRGVVRDEQVLGCPECVASGAFGALLDRCAACGSTALVRRLGETSCRDCAHAGPGVPSPSAAPSPPVEPGALSDEVATALDRFFGR